MALCVSSHAALSVLPLENLHTQLKISASGGNERCAWIDLIIEGTELTVNLALLHKLLQRYPTLPHHSCKSGCTTATQTFADALPQALLPHVVEHIAIELMVRQFPGEVFAGNTTWIEREDQSMRVRISLPKRGDKSEAAEALQDAVSSLNELLASGS